MHAKNLIELVASAPSADNSQQWQFVESPEGIVCRYKDRALKRDPFGPLGHATLMATGALLENFNALRPENGDKPEIAIDGSNWHISVNLSTWNAPLNPAAKKLLLARHTNRHPFLALPNQAIATLPQLFSGRSVFLSTPESIKTLAKALVDCSVERFNNQELHEWLYSSLRWTPAEVDSGTGLDIETLHLPPGGRQFMKWIAPWERMRMLNQFGINRILAVADGALFRQAPGVIAFVGGQSNKDIVDCGQLMQRTWLALNNQCIAVHPYYVLTDLTNRLRQKKLDDHSSNKVARAQAIAAEVLDLHGDEQVHMLLRIGLPATSPVKSRRLPLSTLIAD